MLRDLGHNDLAWESAPAGISNNNSNMIKSRISIALLSRIVDRSALALTVTTDGSLYNCYFVKVVVRNVLRECKFHTFAAETERHLSP